MFEEKSSRGSNGCVFTKQGLIVRLLLMEDHVVGERVLLKVNFCLGEKNCCWSFVRVLFLLVDQFGDSRLTDFLRTRQTRKMRDVYSRAETSCSACFDDCALCCTDTYALIEWIFADAFRGALRTTSLVAIQKSRQAKGSYSIEFEAEVSHLVQSLISVFRV